MVPAQGTDQPSKFTDEEIEKLAKAEHVRWVKQKIAACWHHGEETDKNSKIHKCLVPWQLSEPEIAADYTPDERDVLGAEELPDEEKEKDHAFVRDIPTILFLAGYILIKISAD